MTDQEKETIIKTLNFTHKDCLCKAERTDPNYHEHEYSCTQNENGTILFKDFEPWQKEPTTLVTGSVEGLVHILNVNYPTLLNYALSRPK